MLIGVIADDFTGASDIANTLAKGVAPEGGLRTAQYSGIPNLPADKDIEAGVISLKSRSEPTHIAISDSLEALKWLRAQGCHQIIFKYCSTFDSTKQGNIGPVAEALIDMMKTEGALVCPAFPTAGRTVYQGHLFVFDKLLNESGMQFHPLTPMVDSDIRRWLGYQSSKKIGHVAISSVLQGVDQTREAIGSEIESGSRLIVADAITNLDLLTLGSAISNMPLVTGGSGIALGLPRNFIKKGLAKGDGVLETQVEGPEAILVGSCSGATRKQIDFHKLNHPTLSINVHNVMDGTLDAHMLCDFILSESGNAPLVYSSGSPEEVKLAQDKYGREVVSTKLDELFAEVAQRLIEDGYRRIVVAGGETSGAVAKSICDKLGVKAMRIGPEIDPGVPILSIASEDPINLALKSGNFGSDDFFIKALSIMKGEGCE